MRSSALRVIALTPNLSGRWLPYLRGPAASYYFHLINPVLRSENRRMPVSEPQDTDSYLNTPAASHLIGAHCSFLT